MTGISKGYLIYAYNNSELDYGTMAMCCAGLIKKNLTVNTVALVTNQTTLDWITTIFGFSLVMTMFDNVIVTETDHNVGFRDFYDTRYSSKSVPYFNTGRISALALSPFDETILIDSDYLVLDNSLDSVWGSVEDILVNQNIRTLHHTVSIDRFNEMSIPIYWATVVYFKKTALSHSIFDLMSHIKSNYDYYQHLYQFSPNSYYRNDYALSIAIHMLNGHQEGLTASLPIQDTLTASEYDDFVHFENNSAYFVGEKQQGDFSLHKVISNVHIMNKWSIVRQSEKIIRYASN